MCSRHSKRKDVQIYTCNDSGCGVSCEYVNPHKLAIIYRHAHKLYLYVLYFNVGVVYQYQTLTFATNFSSPNLTSSSYLACCTAVNCSCTLSLCALCSGRRKEDI